MTSNGPDYEEPIPEDIDVDVTETLTKNRASVKVDDYEYDWDEKIFEDCDIERGYRNSYLSPADILDKVVKYALKAKENGEKYFLGEKIDYLIECASGWESLDTYVEFPKK